MPVEVNAGSAARVSRTRCGDSSSRDSTRAENCEARVLTRSTLVVGPGATFSGFETGAERPPQPPLVEKVAQQQSSTTGGGEGCAATVLNHRWLRRLRSNR